MFHKVVTDDNSSNWVSSREKKVRPARVYFLFLSNADHPWVCFEFWVLSCCQCVDSCGWFKQRLMGRLNKQASQFLLGLSYDSVVCCFIKLFVITGRWVFFVIYYTCSSTWPSPMGWLTSMHMETCLLSMQIRFVVESLSQNCYRIKTPLITHYIAADKHLIQYCTTVNVIFCT